MAMKNYYEILGVAETAAKNEIKKAYFGLVRQYPPEKEPEKFKEYRKAYEVLFDENSRKEYDSVKSIPELYRDAFDYAREMMEFGDYEEAIDELKTIVDQYPDLIIVNCMLAEAYSMNGNTGNAVKIFEKIVRLEPDNMAYQRSLGDAYADRGFNKKALEQFQKTLKLEPDNPDVYAGIAKLYIETEQYRLAKENLLMGFQCADKYGLDNIGLLICGCALCIHDLDTHELSRYLEMIGQKLVEDPSLKEMIVSQLMQQVFVGSPIKNSRAGYFMIIEFLAEHAPEIEVIQELQQGIKNHRTIEELDKDDNIPDLIAALTNINMDDCDCPTCQIERISIQLSIFDNIEEIRKALHYLRKNYPDVYSLNADFYNNVMNIKKEQWMYEKLYKKYQQLRKRYPEEFKQDGWDEEEELPGFSEPYVREEKKIGRNDPCPCGSGKKYKKCCGANK